MRPDYIEQMIDDAVYNVVWGDWKPKYEYLAEYVPGSMMAHISDPDWDPFEMFRLEQMALSIRKQYGFDQLPKQD